MSQKSVTGRLDQSAGIAIGPILFIIAILAILAAAIAAGSGGFMASTSGESDKTKAGALIQIGANLKIGMDRIIMEGGMLPTGASGAGVVNYSVTATNLTNDLFSPSGGGISPPSAAMANTPGTDVWYFVQGPIVGVGSGGSNNDVVAVLRVAQSICAGINNLAVGSTTIPAVADLGDFATNAATGTNWPLASATGCVQNNDAGSTGYYYYQVLAVQ